MSPGKESEFPLLMAELRRVEALVNEKTAIVLTFTDGRSGRILWNLSGLRAGVFMVRRGIHGKSDLSLRFNSSIIRTVGEERFLPTVAHEYAHAIVHSMRHGAGRGRMDDFRPHGIVWSTLMKIFGHPPERCHSYPATSVQKRTVFSWRCGRCLKDYRLGIIRHRRLEKAPGYLVCGVCRGPLLHEPEQV